MISELEQNAHFFLQIATDKKANPLELRQTKMIASLVPVLDPQSAWRMALAMLPCFR